METCEQMGAALGIENINVSVVSRKALLTNILPVQLQIFDPDLIFSWQNDHNGIGRCIIESLDYGFDFTGRISRQPGKVNDKYVRLLQKCRKDHA